MLRKTMWIFLSVALVFTVQSWAKTAAIGPVHDGAIAVDNPLIPEAPGPVIDQTDEVIFFDDFESGGVGWEFMDLTDVSSWHVDDYNAYGSSGLPGGPEILRSVDMTTTGCNTWSALRWTYQVLRIQP